MVTPRKPVINVKSQAMDLPLLRGFRLLSPARLPSFRNKPIGSREDGIDANLNASFKTLLQLLCLVNRDLSSFKSGHDCDWHPVCTQSRNYTGNRE